MWAVLLCTAYARPYDFNENKQKRQARVNEHGNNKYHVFSEWFWFDRYPLTVGKAYWIDSSVCHVLNDRDSVFFYRLDK